MADDSADDEARPLLEELHHDGTEEHSSSELETTGFHEGTEGGARLGDAQKVVIKNPSNINDLVQYLDTSLSDAQFQSIQLSCSSALGIPDEQIGGDGANNSFSVLYTKMKNMLTEEVQGVLCFMLERVSYDMTGLEWLPKFDKTTIKVDAARKLDMFLSLASMITSMTVEEYERFRDQLVRQGGVTDNQERILHDYSADRINCRCHLLKLLHDQGKFNIDVDIVFHLLDKSGCSNCRTEIVKYCNRYELNIPEPPPVQVDAERNETDRNGQADAERNETALDRNDSIAVRSRIDDESSHSGADTSQSGSTTSRKRADKSCK